MHSRLLVIDDSTTIRATVKAYLKGSGVDIFDAQDGFEAIKIVQKERPDLVLVDVMMPRLTGYQFCSLLKNNAALSGLKVYMLTSKDTIIDKAKADLAGADGYIVKPFKKDQLYELLQSNGFRLVKPATAAA